MIIRAIVSLSLLYLHSFETTVCFIIVQKPELVLFVEEIVCFGAEKEDYTQVDYHQEEYETELEPSHGHLHILIRHKICIAKNLNINDWDDGLVEEFVAIQESCL